MEELHEPSLQELCPPDKGSLEALHARSRPPAFSLLDINEAAKSGQQLVSRAFLIRR
ncbi:hypothetical protein [Bradyrhizobium sp. CCBAU 11357]|uniref:hypothetical protein n=1 Tax=Bradyrhizobium sp. CCBAU 11357 TaxID=1630808 RepID=UPI0023023D4B|nr:hypothetical protein [Bradyrhizobium sp. CCBAU 11357]